MALSPGQHTLGPDDGALRVRTGKTGAAAKAGHNLLMEVGSWRATIELGDDNAISLQADGGSLRVLEGSGGIQALGEEDKNAIKETIDGEVLKGTAIEFRSTQVQLNSETLRAEGELQLAGAAHPVSFELTLDDDGRLNGSARFKQSDWGIKPYSTLFGTLKVADEVEVTIDARVG